MLTHRGKCAACVSAMDNLPWTLQQLHTTSTAVGEQWGTCWALNVKSLNPICKRRTSLSLQAARKRPAVGDLLGHPWIALHQKRAAPVVDVGRGSSCDMASLGSVGSDMSTGTAAPADALR